MASRLVKVRSAALQRTATGTALEQSADLQKPAHRGLRRPASADKLQLCRLALAASFVAGSSHTTSAPLLEGLTQRIQQLHHRPYLPRGTAERCLLLLTSILQVSPVLFGFS